MTLPLPTSAAAPVAPDAGAAVSGAAMDGAAPEGAPWT